MVAGGSAAIFAEYPLLMREHMLHTTTPASEKRDEMLITMAMCTWNRANQLGRALNAAAAMTIPESVEWEFIIVDNGSTDDTAEIVSSFCDHLPIRCFHEPTPGLSNARNRVVAETRGDFVCWTDDDVLVDKAWLFSYCEAFVRFPEMAVFGGPIKPVFEGAQPEWFIENRKRLGEFFAERDLGPDIVPLSLENIQLPYGANYAVRTKEQRRYLYDPNLGVGPRQKRLGEEVEVIHAIIAEGGRGLWIPGALVEHIIPASRVSLDYVKGHQEAAGETWAYLNHAPKRYNFMGSIQTGGRKFMGAPLWMWRMTVTHGIEYWLAYISAPSVKWMENLLRYRFYYGALRYYIKNRKNAKLRSVDCKG
jgi:glycosyltransferase involved in cell wall biosynthesis